MIWRIFTLTTVVSAVLCAAVCALHVDAQWHARFISYEGSGLIAVAASTSSGLRVGVHEDARADRPTDADLKLGAVPRTQFDPLARPAAMEPEPPQWTSAAAAPRDPTPLPWPDAARLNQAVAAQVAAPHWVAAAVFASPAMLWMFMWWWRQAGEATDPSSCHRCGKPLDSSAYECMECGEPIRRRQQQGVIAPNVLPHLPGLRTESR